MVSQTHSVSRTKLICRNIISVEYITQPCFRHNIYFDAYERMGLTIDQLKPFPGTLVVFSNEEVEILGYIQLEVIFGTGSSARMIPVKFLVIRCSSSYNVIIGRPFLNTLGAVML